jgi:hypothetical protein
LERGEKWVVTPYLVGKLKTGFEGGYSMSRNRDGRILADITPYFLGASFENKATKSADVNGLALGQGIFDDRKKGFNDRTTGQAIKTGSLTDLVNYILFCHTYLTGFEESGNKWTTKKLVVTVSLLLYTTPIFSFR